MTSSPDAIRPERRRHKRILTSVRCWILGRQSALYTKVRNISRGGLGVLGPVPFKSGDEVTIRILGVAPQRDLVIRSRVVWSQDAPLNGMGAEFLAVLAGAQLLEQILGGQD